MTNKTKIRTVEDFILFIRKNLNVGNITEDSSIVFPIVFKANPGIKVINHEVWMTVKTNKKDVGIVVKHPSVNPHFWNKEPKTPLNTVNDFLRYFINPFLITTKEITDLDKKTKVVLPYYHYLTLAYCEADVYMQIVNSNIELFVCEQYAKEVLIEDDAFNTLVKQANERYPETLNRLND